MMVHNQISAPAMLSHTQVQEVMLAFVYFVPWVCPERALVMIWPGRGLMSASISVGGAVGHGVAVNAPGDTGSNPTRGNCPTSSLQLISCQNLHYPI